MSSLVTDRWALESAGRPCHLADLLTALHQAERAACGGLVAVAVLHEAGQRHDDDLVVLRWRDFADLLIGEHETDQRLAARVAALVNLADATPEERAILAPDAQT